MQAGKGSPASRTSGAKQALKREAPPTMIIAAVVVLVIALGAAAFYVYNGGWETQGKKEWRFQHEIGPILNAKRGMMGTLERENALRKLNGEPLLQVPKDRHENMAEQRQKLLDLQNKLGIGQGGQ